MSNEYTDVRSRLVDLIDSVGLSRAERKLFDELLIDLDAAVRPTSGDESFMALAREHAELKRMIATHLGAGDTLKQSERCFIAALDHATSAQARRGDGSGPTRQVWYMAHPVAGDVEGNLARAERWLGWLMQRNTDAAFIAPWISQVRVGDDADAAQRERGLLDCEAAAARCDGIVLVGGRVSTGMRREAEAAKRAGRPVVDLTTLGELPPGPMRGVSSDWFPRDSWGDAARAVADRDLKPDNCDEPVNGSRCRLPRGHQLWHSDVACLCAPSEHPRQVNYCRAEAERDGAVCELGWSIRSRAVTDRTTPPAGTPVTPRNFLDGFGRFPIDEPRPAVAEPVVCNAPIQWKVPGGIGGVLVTALCVRPPGHDGDHSDALAVPLDLSDVDDAKEAG